jgi:hypothetical protein
MDPKLRRHATQDEILTAIRDRIRDTVPDCAEPKHCFISDQPIPDGSIFPTVSHFVTVSAGRGSFDQSLFTGGGHRTCNEDLQVILTPIVQMNLDRLPAGEQRLLHAKRGMSVWKRNLLSAMLLEDPEDPNNSRAWEPVVDQRPLLRSQLRPLNSTEVADVPGGLGHYGIHLTFSCSFDWKLGIES